LTVANLLERCKRATASGQDVLSYVDDAYAIAGPSALREKVVAAFDPFAIPAPAGIRAEVQVCAVPEAAPADLLDWVETAGERIDIDVSLYPTATDGWSMWVGGTRLVLTRKTRTLFALAPGSRLAGVFNADPISLEIDTMRLLKSLIALHCEARGMRLLHASGIEFGGCSVLFAGDSRNGKTTMLLEAMAGFEAGMLSCDTSIVYETANGLRVRGWPSNFSVSVGTMLDFSDLLSHLTPPMRKLSYREAWDIHPKHVLLAADVAAGANWRIQPGGRLAAIVALSLSPEGGIGLTPLSGAELDEFLTGVTLGSADPLYPDWHGFWEEAPPPNARPLPQLGGWVRRGELEAYAMRWAPPAQTLLRRVPVLDRIHRNTTAVARAGGEE
jgi:HAMP domain-containing protein